MKKSKINDPHKFMAQQGFADLLFTYFYFLEKKDTLPGFGNYNVFFCQQAVEKFFKAFLMNIDPQYDEEKIKKEFSHRIVELINKINHYLNEADNNYFFKNVTLIGLDFHRSFGLAKNDFNMEDKRIEKFPIDLIKKYGAELNFYSLFLSFLKHGFFEARYPHKNYFDIEVQNPINSSGMLSIIYDSQNLFNATFSTCSVIMQFLSHETKNYLAEIYTWEHACEGYSEETPTIRMNFLVAEILLERLCSKI